MHKRNNHSKQPDGQIRIIFYHLKNKLTNQTRTNEHAQSPIEVGII